MRKITADIIYTNAGAPRENGVLIVEDDGSVVEVLDLTAGLEGVETHRGALCPGFVNVHCHLELSHLFGKLPQKKGLLNFLKPIIELRVEEEEIVQAAMLEADKTMNKGGIVAVGDICNESVSFDIKLNSDIHYHNFIEVIGIDPSKSEERFGIGDKVYQESIQMGLPCSIVPHAPYTISPELLAKIDQLSEESGSPVCFHSQESEAERDLFQNRSGAFVDFYKGLGLEIDFFNPKNDSSVAWMASNLSSAHKLMAVHNTYTTPDDIVRALENHPEMYWCFCPKANLFIEDKTPDFSLFMDYAERITIGTDSLASNTSLSVLEELKTIALEEPTIELADLIKWATINGAEFLGMSEYLGSFERGKKPGVNLINSLNENDGHLTPVSQVTKLA